MGGLVVKKAYILGHQEPEFLPIVERVCSILFLATPHQGSSLAQTLSRLIALVPGARPFVDDLMPQSTILQSINEEFPRICSKLQLISFYETRPMNLGVNRSLIVEKMCAVMNVPNERRTLLDADHRNVAMFSTPEDSAYLAVRNALATVIGSQRDSSHSHKRLHSQEDQTSLSRFLCIFDAPEDDIMTCDSVRLPGSCEWFKTRGYYLSWKEVINSRFLWIRGRPGAGKSILAGHVVNDIRDTNMDCSFFFFQSSDNAKSTTNVCLRSLAWQMAALHPEVSKKIREIMKDSNEELIDLTDSNPVWRKIYLSGILKVKLDRPQFWVIDSIDECKGSSELMSFLTRIQEQWPVSILVTSRDPVEAHLGKTNHQVDIRSEVISDEDSKHDIALFLRLNINLLPCPSSSKWATPWDMATQIIEKSGGCFLWASLICSELREAYTEREIEQVLESIPPNMDALYSKILEDMAFARFGKDLAKSILTWTTYSFRPLSAIEIKEPIEIDINDKIDDIERSISKCCGNLVYVDTHGKVQLVHSTAREFLTRKDIISDFTVTKAEGHRRLAIVCLQHLIKTEAGVPKPKRHGSDLDVKSISSSATVSPFTNYASTFLFRHLSMVHSNDEEVLLVLAKFLGGSTVLCWIEFIASNGDLRTVYQAGKTINTLLSRRAQHSPPMGFAPKNLALLDKWGDDLIHLATKFSRWLKLVPGSIHHLIPPFCPQGSAIRQQFANPYRGINVQGLPSNGWDDCLTTITYPRGTRPNVVTTGPGFFAIGMMNGQIYIYDDSIFQEIHVLKHREPVWRMASSANGDYVASAGAKMVRIWSPQQGQELMTFSIPSLCLAMAFGDDDSVLRVATRQNQLIEWDMGIEDYLRDEAVNWTADFEEAYQFRTPTMIGFGSASGLLSIIYRGEDIILWDFAEERIHDVYEQDVGSKMYGSIKIPGGSSTVRAVAFSEAADTNRLATTYTDGDLVIYDTLEGRLVATAEAVNTMLIASSYDGRTLAGCDSKGNLTLFDFETLRSLYRVQFDTPTIPKGLAFTADSRRFIEIRGDQCRVWEPSVLLRQDTQDEDISDTVSVSTGPQEVIYQTRETTNITAIACCGNLGVVFCAKEDGSVHVYDISSEPESHQLFVQAAGCPIDFLALDEDQMIIACGDLSGRITARKVERRHGPQRKLVWEVEEPLINVRSPSHGLLKQILVSGKHGRLLVVSENFDTLWPMPNEAEGRWIDQIRGSGRPLWAVSRSKPDLLLHVNGHGFETYDWQTLKHLESFEAHLNDNVEQMVSLNHPRIFATVHKSTTVTDATAQRSFQLWDLDQFNQEHSPPSAPAMDTAALSSKFGLIVGAFGNRLVVYTTDNWVVSIDMEDPSSKDAMVRHFLVPSDWISITNRFIMGIGRYAEILIAKQSDLAVIKRGLEVLESGGSFNPRRGSTQRGGNLAVRHSRTRGLSPGSSRSNSAI